MIWLIIRRLKAKFRGALLGWRLGEDKITTDTITEAMVLEYFACYKRAEMVRRSRRHNQGIFLVGCDVDNFKTVNNTLGHPAGDFVLKLCSQALSNHRELDIVRLGGDEFMTVLIGSNAEHSERYCQELSIRLQRVLTDPKNLQHLKFLSKKEIPEIQDALSNIGISTGLSQWHYDSEPYDDAYLRVDMMMYENKRANKTLRLFDSTNLQTATG